MMIGKILNSSAKSFLLGAVMLGSSLSISQAGSIQQPTGVLEMFTSQGCSSCPPADEVLARYVKQNQVLALSWHVDYWNYLGWKDTFSKAEFTDRQRRYAASFKRRGVYTPQAVVNGRTHVVGSHGGEIEDLVKSYQKSGKGLTVPIKVSRSGKKVRVTGANAGDAKLWIVYFDEKRQVKIKKGENRGKTITYHNVVREVSVLGMAKDGAIDVTLPMDELKRKGFEACALILQQSAGAGLPGPIIGATVIGDLLDS